MNPAENVAVDMVDSARKPFCNTIHGLIQRQAENRPGALFLVSPDSGRKMTYGELLDSVKRVGQHLRGMGLKRGDKVAFLMDNGLSTIELFLGVMANGHVLVPLNVRAGATTLGYTLEHSDASAVFVEEQYLSLYREASANLKRTIPLVMASVDAMTWKGSEGLETDSHAEPDDVALLMYTSGSTGKPKAAVHTQKTILAHGYNSMRSHELTETDCSLLVLPLYHINAECVTLMPTLASGGTVVVPQRFNVSQFWDWLEEYQCTWSAIVPTIISQLLDWKDPRANERQKTFKRIRFLRSSSAPLSPALHREFLGKFDLWLIQAMGCSEGGNVFSNPQRPGTNKVGSAGLAWGFETRVIDPDGREVKPGEPGEVLLRGPALMAGYYKDPEGTASVLDKDGWFHTGDLAYQDADGYFFVVGRSKELIIKGGVNIAPKQIDEVLESHPAVKEAAAVGVTDRYVGEDVVAYAVLRTGVKLEERELQAFCEERLGPFKTPTRIFFVEDLPKGPSGKVQRLKLQEQATAAVEASAQASAAAITAEGTDGRTKPTPIEQIIVAIWMDLLKQPHVGLQSNFFSLGGHSLLAIQSLSRLREKVPVALSLSDFFKQTTVAGQAALVRQRLKLDEPASPDLLADLEQKALKQIQPFAEKEVILQRMGMRTYELSPAQERLWFIEQLNIGTPVYNESEAVRLEGPLNLAALERALNMVASRHEILRTTIEVQNLQPLAIINAESRLDLKQIDLQLLEDAEQGPALQSLLVAEPQRPYNLKIEPGIRAILIKLRDEANVFVLMMHHIICDRLSIGVLWREVYQFYDAFIKNAPLPDLPLSIQYGDYAAWKREKTKEGKWSAELKFWKQKLKGATSLLDLPTDRPRPAVVSYRGVKTTFNLGKRVAEALRAISRAEKVSLFTTFTAALNTVLFRYTNNPDILVGIPISERDRPELQPLIGFFIDTQVLRSDLSGNPTFHELIHRIKDGLLEVYTNNALPFAEVVKAVKPERNLSYSPLFQVMLNWRDHDAQIQFIGLPGVTVHPLLAQSMTSKFDLSFFLTDAVDDVLLEVEYNSDIFNPDRIERMVGHLKNILQATANNAAQRLTDIPLLTEAERELVLEGWNRTGMSYPKDRSVADLVREQAARTPEGIAVEYAGQKLTYRELEERAERLGVYLQELGVGPGDLVAICVERSLAMVVGLLGILKAGGAYVPMDPGYPAERLAFMIEDAQPKVVLTEGRWQSILPATSGQVVLLDEGWEQKVGRVGKCERRGLSEEDRAYVIFTSGSTGRPKGVEIPHGALTNFLVSMQQKLEFSAQEVLVAVTTLSFDIAGLELWLPLISGARVVVASREVAMDGERLNQLLAEVGATVMQATPATWRLLIEAGWKGGLGFKALCGGEAWSGKLAEELGVRSGALWNLYGPTETTIWSAALKVGKGEAVLIGPPIGNTQLYVLDGNLQPVPVGVPGELWIGGDGLALGYLKRPELTAEKFVADPFSGKPGTKMYRTGDLVRRQLDGKIEFLNRIDNQIKIRGFRIELGEIEATITQHPMVKESVVVVKKNGAEEARLVAYIVPKPFEQPENFQIKSDHVRGWQNTWDNAYSNQTSSFFAGWLNSYDGQPIPDHEMLEWADTTAQRVANKKPERILELGCGTGMMLFRLLEGCKQYVGIDQSSAALKGLQQRLAGQPEQAGKVTLLEKQADGIDDLAAGSFDAVIINSVAQYFPGIEYLTRVLTQAARVVRPGGFIFVGDVRNFVLLEAFHCSMLIHSAPAELPLSELKQRIKKKISQEEELLVAPEFFSEASHIIPGVNSAEIELKRGYALNEMTKFRYDVVLHIGEGWAPDLISKQADWGKDRLTLGQMADDLKDSQPETFLVRGIPSARLQRESHCLRLLNSGEDIQTVGDLREAIDSAVNGSGIEPEDVWRLGEKMGYSVSLAWSENTCVDSFDAIFRKNKPKIRPIQSTNSHPTGKLVAGESYANDPLRLTHMRKLSSNLREFLKAKMPEYMVPSSFMELDSFPRTPNGKVDRKALPTPDNDQRQFAAQYIAPKNATEQALAEIWAKELGREKVGVNDNFFDMGGHSLLLVRIQSKLQDALRVKVSIVDLFQFPTISMLSKHLSKSAEGTDRLQKMQDRNRQRPSGVNRYSSLRRNPNER